MNRENLQRMADYIRTVPQRSFAMDTYRGPLDTQGPKCNSVGCIIGHCTILDADLINELLHESCGSVYAFAKWSFLFTGLSDSEDSWYWCFGWRWAHSDNTPTGAADRIEWLLENGLPENWRAQMSGDAPLCYKK